MKRRARSSQRQRRTGTVQNIVHVYCKFTIQLHSGMFNCSKTKSRGQIACKSEHKIFKNAPQLSPVVVQKTHYSDLLEFYHNLETSLSLISEFLFRELSNPNYQMQDLISIKNTYSDSLIYGKTRQKDCVANTPHVQERNIQT